MKLRDIWVPLVGIPSLPLLYLATREEIKQARRMGLHDLERFWKEEWWDLVWFITRGWAE